MLGYFNKPEETGATITPDGWLKTGDLGKFDEQGYLSVTGRIKEMFKVGGTNAYPAEIENYLAQHPDISMAAVVGVPDERLGEVAFAFIIPRAGTTLDAADVVGHCKRGIANYKVPRYVRFVSDFPRTPSGKIRKVELAATARSEIAVLETT
jgi:fatty-acyl-CoA synthase